MSHQDVLEISEIYTYYGEVPALSGVSLRIGQGEVVALLGANGAGKTTTISTIYGVLPARKGSMLFHGRRLNGLTPDAVVRLGIGYVPERRQLFYPMSVEDNLLLGAYSRYNRKNKAQIRQDMVNVFNLFPVLLERRKQRSGTLSGGQQQMLAIGRSLMSSPKLLLLDEPSLGLAPLAIVEMMKTVAKLKEQGFSILLSEQNTKAALSIADRGYVMENGKIVMEGSAAQLLSDKGVRAAYLGEEMGV